MLVLIPEVSLSPLGINIRWLCRSQARIQEFQDGGGAVEFFDLRFALMPLYTYPMFVLEEK